VIRLLLSGCHLRPASLTTSLFWHSNATRHLPHAANHPTRLLRLRPAVCRRHDHCLPGTRSLTAKGVCCCKAIIGEAAASATQSPSDSPTTHGLYLSVTGHFGNASVADVRLVSGVCFSPTATSTPYTTPSADTGGAQLGNDRDSSTIGGDEASSSLFTNRWRSRSSAILWQHSDDSSLLWTVYLCAYGVLSDVMWCVI